MGRKKVGWGDESVTSGYDDSLRENRFRGTRGTKYLIRVLTDAMEYRVHTIDDVLDADEETGEARCFNMNCSLDWDEDKEDWVGKCIPCEEEYDANSRFVCGLVLLATQKGRGKWQSIDPENSVMYWDFGRDKYVQLRDIELELQRAKTKKKGLKHVELVVTCGNKRDDETFQKLRIQISQDEPAMTRDYLEAFKAEGLSLVERASAGDDPKVQARKLKKKKPKKSTKKDDDEDDQDEDPKPSKKKGARRVSKPKKDEDPEDDDDSGDEAPDTDDLDDLLDELEDE